MLSRDDDIQYVDPEQVSAKHLQYQKNRFAQELGRYGHCSFNQFIRGLTYKIMGEEASVPIQELAVNSHCPTLDTDFYRFAKPQPWAPRKKYNPFKWVELGVTAPFEIMRWGCQRGFFQFRESFLAYCSVTRDMGQPFTESTTTTLGDCFKRYPVKTVGACLVGTVLATGAVTFAVFNETVFAGLRRYLAPVRYVIRPSIELYKEHAKTFMAMCLAAVMLTIVLSMLVTNQELFNLESFLENSEFFDQFFKLLSAATIGEKAGMVVVIASHSWAVCLRTATGIRESGQILQRALMGRPRREQEVSQFQYLVKGTTTQVTAVFHGLNAALTDIRPLQEQTLRYKAALSTGTDALFFPTAGINRETAKNEFVFFMDLRKYPKKRQKERSEQMLIELAQNTPDPVALESSIEHFKPTAATTARPDVTFSIRPK